MTASMPSGPIHAVQGRPVVLRGNDIDTDRIIPARFLKCVTFDGLGEQVFAHDRAELKGQHPFDRPEHQGASLLLVNRNFGCGSSREHAPQALMRWGIRGVVGESFAEIFHGNCLALGIPCLVASSEQIQQIQSSAEQNSDATAHLSLDPPSLKLADARWELELASGPSQMLRSGQWDGTSQLLANASALEATAARLPYLQQFAAKSAAAV